MLVSYNTRGEGEKGTRASEVVGPCPSINSSSSAAFQTTRGGSMEVIITRIHVNTECHDLRSCLDS